MNENLNSISYNHIKMVELCQTCLTSVKTIFPMSCEDMECYGLIVGKVEDPLNLIYICVYCKSNFRKINRFIKQCRYADLLLKDTLNKDSKFIQRLDSSQLSTSATVFHYVGPDPDLRPNESANFDDEKFKSDVSKYIDEDDLPLVFLNEGNDNQYDDEDNKEVDNELDDSIESNTEPNKETDRRSKKFKKKEVRDGFSSRMVKETEEYEVIKLTRDEIIKEMQRNSESEKYKMLPYKCMKCVRGFNFDDVLQSHMAKHSSENGPFECNICYQYCPNKVSLRGHMKSHSTRYKCKLCGIIRLSRQHVLEHYSLAHTASAALYSCPKCEHTTNKRTAMQRHVRLHSASEPLKCHLCGKYYKSKESLRVHVMRHDYKKLHQCDICNSTFVYATQLTKHMRAVHVLKDYYCVECDIMFKSMDNLKQHLQRAKRHRDDSSYKFQCPHCEQKFISASTLATHTTNAHGAAKSEACAECARRYSSVEALRWHVRRAHTAHERARLPCALCDRMFSRKSVLRVHMRTHTGERPHACECGAAYAQPAALRAHRSAAHKKPTAVTGNEA